MLGEHMSPMKILIKDQTQIIESNLVVLQDFLSLLKHIMDKSG